MQMIGRNKKGILSLYLINCRPSFRLLSMYSGRCFTVIIILLNRLCAKYLLRNRPSVRDWCYRAWNLASPRKKEMLLWGNYKAFDSFPSHQINHFLKVKYNWI